MATFHGKDGKVKVGGTAVGEVRSFSVEQSASTADDSVMGDAWDTHLQTRNSWTASVECLWDDGAAGGSILMLIGTTVSLELYPEGDTVGDYELAGSATVESVNTSATHDGVVEASITCKGSGTLTIGTA